MGRSGRSAVRGRPATPAVRFSRPSGRRWLQIYVVAVLPVCVVYVALPDPPRYLWTLIGLLSLAGLVTGTIVNRPRRRLPWWLAAAGVSSLMIGDAVYDIQTAMLGDANPFPSFADGPYLAMYPLLASGLFLLIRATTPRGDKDALLDATFVTVAVGLIVWVDLAQPYVQDATLTWMQKAVSIAYPLGDVLILAVLVRLLIGGGRRNRALWLLSVGTVGLFGSDVLYGFIQLDGSWSTGGVVDVGWMLFYVAWGAAALSPDMARLTEPIRSTGLPTSRRRLLVFALIPLLAPALQVWNVTHGTVANVLVTSVASAIMFLLVALRLRELVNAARHFAERENAMRRTGEAFVAASDPAAVYRVGVAAIGDLTGHSRRILIATGSPLRLVFDSTRADAPTVEDVEGALQRHRGELRRQGFVLTTADRCGPELSSAWAPDAVVLLAAMVRGDQIRGVLVVGGEGVDRPEIIDPMCSLASQMMLAIDSIELTAQVTQRRSEAHFRALIQTAADIILVVDEQLRLSFHTPSAELVLGWDAADTVARSIDSVVVAADVARARLLLQRVMTGESGSRAAGRPHDEWRVADRHGVVRLFGVSCRNLTDDPSVGGVVVTLHDITDRRKLEDDLKYQAFHDSLTQLPNRSLFLDRVEHALARSGRHRERLAVLLVDLDNFKVINDTRGHAAGDELLRQVACRLRGTMRAEGTCARLGGDEFAILAEGLATDAEAGQLADRLAERLRTPFEICGESITVGASIGVSTSDYEASASDLLLQADLAMYAAKDAGKGSTRFFQPELLDLMQLRARKAKELEWAVEREEFTLHFQPVVSLVTERVIGFEALLRWEHPERGLLLPGEFIDIIEESELSVTVGSWVVDRAIAQAAAWQRYAPVDGPLKMSINVTPRELAHPGFVPSVVAALQRHGLPSEAVVLEITERVLVGTEPQIIGAMARLQELGVRLAVDDFGTGYAALGYLRRFPVSTLKIDRSFVAGLGTSSDDHALVEAIIGLGRTFDLDLIAEGLETDEQRRELLLMGCHGAQGFLYSRPMPAQDAEAYLDAILAAGSEPALTDLDSGR